MITVGLYAGDTDLAAAAAVDGRVAAALDLTRQRGVSDIEACRSLIREVLMLAGLSPADVQQLTIVEGGGLSRQVAESPAAIWGEPAPRTSSVCPYHATAAQLCGHAPAGTVAVQHDTQEAAWLFPARDGQLDSGRRSIEAENAVRAAALVARALGLCDKTPLSALERVAATRTRLTAPDVSDAEPAVAFSPSVAQVLVAQALTSCPDLADGESRHIAVQAARATLATATLDAVADTLSRSIRAAAPAGTLHGLAGSAFASSVFTDRMRQRLPSSIVAPVLSGVGAALGAAVLPHQTPAPIEHLALGPDADETEVKATLENCRLDFVYEPDWSKLAGRVSALLSTGALVAWCQGPREFGGRSFGSRSVLADPSKRYVRENVNVFLLRREALTPLPVTMLGQTWSAGYDVTRGTAGHLAAAADQHGRVLVHRQPAVVAPRLAELIGAHEARTGVAGLINVSFTDRDGHLVRTTRDAVREAFSSAVDVLVLGRFLVSKDYWLIRSR